MELRWPWGDGTLHVPLGRKVDTILGSEHDDTHESHSMAYCREGGSSSGRPGPEMDDLALCYRHSTEIAALHVYLSWIGDWCFSGCWGCYVFFFILFIFWLFCGSVLRTTWGWVPAECEWVVKLALLLGKTTRQLLLATPDSQTWCVRPSATAKLIPPCGGSFLSSFSHSPAREVGDQGRRGILWGSVIPSGDGYISSITAILSCGNPQRSTCMLDTEVSLVHASVH